MKRSTKIIMAVAIIGTVVAIIWLAGVRDKALMQWADSYEQCVQDEYHTTPTQWYLEQGEYPECDTSDYE